MGMLVKLVTPAGYEFWGESLVNIDGKDFALNEMTQQQHDFVMTAVDLHALNTVFAGQATFTAEGMPVFEAVFPKLVEG